MNENNIHHMNKIVEFIYENSLIYNEVCSAFLNLNLDKLPKLAINSKAKI